MNALKSNDGILAAETIILTLPKLILNYNFETLLFQVRFSCEKMVTNETLKAFHIFLGDMNSTSKVKL